MAIKLLYGPGYGPFIYDDTTIAWYPDGLPLCAGRTDGQVYIEQAPTHDWHVVRLMDLIDYKVWRRHFLLMGG
jgi:hypothetical protein